MLKAQCKQERKAEQLSWLRTDDGFDSHRKILALGDGVKGDARRWTWNRILLYTARYGSSEIPPNIGETIPRASKAFLLDCVTIGLVDETPIGLVVHDWPLYADIPIAEKVDYYLNANPTASANECVKAIGAKREIVLHEVSRFRNGSQPGSGGTVISGSFGTG